MANTLAPLSETAIANMAATTLDDTHLNSLDDDTPLARFISSEYGFARDELLRTHIWSCAKTRKNLPRLSAPPPFGYDFQYQLPVDCLRLIPPRVDGHPNAPLIPYTKEGNVILTNYPAPLCVVYIKRIVNPTEFDPLCARALGQYIAVLASQRVTGKESYYDKATRLFQGAITSAHQVNALEIGDTGGNSNYTGSSVFDARLRGC